MTDTKSDKNKKAPSKEGNASGKKKYYFGGIEEISLEKIEEEILNESLYLDVFAGSALVFKDNVSSLKNILPALLSLNCIKYDYKTAEFPEKNFPITSQYGVIAEEVQKVFPELVMADEKGRLHVNYTQLSTVAIQAVKELTAVVESNEERLSRLEAQLLKLTNDKK